MSTDVELDTDTPQEAAAPRRGPGRPRKTRKAAGSTDTAPRPSSAAGRGPGRPTNIEKLGEHLTAQFVALGMVAFAFDPRVGAILVDDAPAHGAALAKLAEQNPRVRRFLEGGLTGSAWIGVAVAFGSTGFKIAQAVKSPAEAPASSPEPTSSQASGAPVTSLFGSFATGTDGP